MLGVVGPRAAPTGPAVVVDEGAPSPAGRTTPAPVSATAALITSAPTAERAATPVPSAALVAATGPSASPGGARPDPTVPPPADRWAAAHILLEAHFADAHQGWRSDPDSTAWSAAGVYRLRARTPGQFVAVEVPLGGPLRDVSVSGTFRKLGGPPGGGYGLIVRDRGPGPRDGVNQDGRFYVFEVGDRGDVGVWRREGDHWDALVPWRASETVRPGDGPNELTAVADGPRLAFLVNGSAVATLPDPSPLAGGVGLFAGGDLNEVAVEQLIVWAP
jgi:hypothetical protein